MPAGPREAFVITEIHVSRAPPQGDGQPMAVGKVSSPTPTLVVDPDHGGLFHVWIGGFEQPSPPGPPAGEYLVRVKIQGTVNTETRHEATARLLRIFPAESPPATLEGRITDARTGQPPTAAGPVVVHVGNPTSVRVLRAEDDTAIADPGGRFRMSVPPGAYWVRAEAPGYRSTFFGPLELETGATSQADLTLVPDAPAPIVTNPVATANAGLPTYRLATSLGLERVATAPGFYTRTPNQAPEEVSFFAASGTRLWHKPLPPPSKLPVDIGEWTSTDHGLDVNADGTLVAIGTSNGTIDVYDDGGGQHWSHRDDATQNSRVPGPFGVGIRRSSEVRFSDDGEFLAAGTLTGFVHHFNVTTGRLVWSFETAGQVRALRYDANATTLFAGSGDNHLYAIDTTTGLAKWTADLTFWPWEHIALTQDAARIAVGGKDGVLRVFDADGAPLWTRQFPGFLLGYDFDPTGAHLVALADNGVYDFDATGRLRWFRQEIQSSGQLRVGAGGQYIGYGKASTRADEATARVLGINGTLAWELRAGNEPESVYNVRFLEDGSRLVANGRQGRLYTFANWLEPRNAAIGFPSHAPEGPAGPVDEPAPGIVLSAIATLAAMLVRRRRY